MTATTPRPAPGPAPEPPPATARSGRRSARRQSSGKPYGLVWRNPQARGLLVAQGISEIGDQIARVAVAFYVHATTDSLVLTGLALALSYLPGIITFAMGSLADRYPRRTVMLVADLSRAVLIGALAWAVGAGAALWLVYALLLTAEILAGPFASARAALFADVIDDPQQFVAVQGMSRSINLGTQVAGALASGLLLTVLTFRAALLLDVATFLASFVLVLVAVRPRPAADEPGTSFTRFFSDMSGAARELLTDPVRRSLTLLGWGSSFFLIAPEAVALGYRDDLATPVASALFVALVTGSVVGSLLLPRVSLHEQMRLLLPLAALSCLPLFATSIDPPPAVAMLLWFVSGVLSAYVLTVIAGVVWLTAPQRRGRVVGFAAGGFNLLTAASFVTVGWLAELDGMSPARAVSLAGAAGLVMVALLRMVWPSEQIARAFR